MAYGRKGIGYDGMIHGLSLAKAAQEQKPCKGERDNLASYLQKEDADICLNCKKSECTGSDECFKKHKKAKKKT